MAEQETDRIVRAYLEILENGEEGPHFASESWLPENRELISEALLSVLIRLPGHSDWERWRAGFIELERYLNEEDWGLVEEFSNRAEEGPEAILAMDKERMQAANGVTRAVSQRKIARMEKLNEPSRGRTWNPKGNIHAVVPPAARTSGGRGNLRIGTLNHRAFPVARIPLNRCMYNPLAGGFASEWGQAAPRRRSISGVCGSLPGNFRRECAGGSRIRLRFAA